MRRVGIIRPEAVLAALWALAGAGCGAAGPGGPPPPPGVAETPPPVPACQPAPRLPTFHRLNRTEYHNSVNALLGIQLPLRPGSCRPMRCCTGSTTTPTPPVSAPLVQRYLNLAQSAVAAALDAPASRASLIPCGLDSATCRRQILQRLLPRAFRRPVTDAEVDEHLGYFDLCDDSPRAGLACALEAALVSPNFLFRTELRRGPLPVAPTRHPRAGRKRSPGPLRAGRAAVVFPVVERSRPGTAGSGGQRPAGGRRGHRGAGEPHAGTRGAAPIPAAVRRELAHAVAGARQHGHGRALGRRCTRRSTRSCAQAMAAESRLFFEEILQQNRSALELVRAPFTFANERLAAHYGLPPVRRRRACAGWTPPGPCAAGC